MADQHWRDLAGRPMDTDSEAAITRPSTPGPTTAGATGSAATGPTGGRGPGEGQGPTEQQTRAEGLPAQGLHDRRSGGKPLRDKDAANAEGPPGWTAY